MPIANREKKNGLMKIENLGKPLLILSAMTTLSVPSVAFAAGSPQKTDQTVRTGEITSASNASDDEQQDQKTAQPASGSAASSEGAASSSGSAADSLGEEASSPDSATTAPSITADASSGKAGSATSSESSTSSGSSSEVTTKVAASSTSGSIPSPTASPQNNDDPTEPNKTTNSVGSSEKTESPSTVAKANIQTIQAPQANFTAVQNLASTSSTSNATAQFISEIGSEAQQIASENNLYASVMITQAILESASGQSGLAEEADNLFGIKGTYNGQFVTMETTEYENGQDVEVAADFRKYPSLSASLEDYANLLKNGLSSNPDYYAKVWKSNASTYEDAAQALQGTYATDPEYASQLDTLISEYDLTKYDSNASGTGTSGSTASGSTSSAASDSGTSSSTSTTAKSGTVGSTVKTNGILYVSSDASTPVKTSLTNVTISRIYSSAVNKYQVSRNGVVVGYLRTLSSTGSAATGRTTTSGSAMTSQSSSSSIKVGTTVATNGVIYLSSTSVAPLITRLTKVRVSKIFPSALNKYQVEINGVVVGYLRFAAASSSSNTASTEKTVGTKLSTGGILYVSSDASTPVKTSLTSATIRKIYSSALNPYQVEVNGTIVGYLR